MAYKKRKRTKKVAEKTQISISVSTDLIKRIDKLAEQQNRNRSNFISNTLLDIVEASE